MRGVGNNMVHFLRGESEGYRSFREEVREARREEYELNQYSIGLITNIIKNTRIDLQTVLTSAYPKTPFYILADQNGIDRVLIHEREAIELEEKGEGNYVEANSLNLSNIEGSERLFGLLEVEILKKLQ